MSPSVWVETSDERLGSADTCPPANYADGQASPSRYFGAADATEDDGPTLGIRKVSGPTTPPGCPSTEIIRVRR